MLLRKWKDLPKFMQTEEVRPYYDSLYKKRGQLLFKKSFDLIASLVLLLILAPIIIALAIWIKLDSKGPVFFRQDRVTQYGKIFRIYKFRTMIHNAEKAGTSVTQKNDNRITKVGNKIRSCRLDEIPQLLNVIQGDMTFVGTRPEIKKYVDAYSTEMNATLLLPAGITSCASIEFNCEDEMLKGCQDIDDVYIKEILPKKMKINLVNIIGFSFLNDLNICFKTIKKDKHVRLR